MKKSIKVFLKRGLIAIVVLSVIVGAGGAFYFKSYLPNTVAPKSFPQTAGEIALEGLNAPVEIYRDKMGIPSIYASTQHDLFFAQGYIHAQDRFWQMDVWRHIGSGTLSEMFGSGQMGTLSSSGLLQLVLQTGRLHQQQFSQQYLRRVISCYLNH